MSDGADLGEHLEDYVAALVRSGRYRSRSDVLREGVRLIEESESRLADVDAALERGLADARDGRVRPADEIVERLTRRYGIQASAG